MFVPVLLIPGGKPEFRRAGLLGRCIVDFEPLYCHLGSDPVLAVVAFGGACPEGDWNGGCDDAGEVVASGTLPG